MLRRIPPLAVAVALVAAALVATVWMTRRTVVDAFETVRDGQAFAVQQAVRADLADLGGPPDVEALAVLVREHEATGLRYLAMLDARGRVRVAAGKPVVEKPGRMDRTGIRIDHLGGRVRIEVRAAFRKAWGPGNGSLWVAMEIEPAQAAELENAATRALAIGGLAAVTLIGVAIWLVRSEQRKRAQELARERERRLASLGEMSAVLAHEIRNPLASLKGNAQLLAASLPEGEKAHARAARVVDEAVRLEKLTKDLLAFVRTGELTRVATAPAQLVREAAASLDGEVLIDDANAPATWSLDAARMREVVVNLLDNARSAGPPVRAAICMDAGNLLIEISDRGPGVRAEDRERIFEPFFTAKTSGTGLGLAIARRIVELHRGTIRVDDGPDGGARFRIEIPEEV